MCQQGKGFTVVCAIGETPQPQIVETGLSQAAAGECMLALEEGTHERFVGEKPTFIGVRFDGAVGYLPTDQFFEHRY